MSQAAIRGIEEGFTRDASERTGRSATSTLLAALFVGAGYYVGAQVGFAVRYPSIPTSIVWPPNAILMAALMLSPVGRWWAYLLCAFLAHLALLTESNFTAPAMLGLFLTNAAQAAIGAFPVRRLCGGAPRFTSLRDLVVFLFFAIFAAPFVTSFADAAIVVLSKSADNYALVWQARFWSNVLTVLALVPAAVLWATRGRDWLRAASPRLFAEACLLGAGLVAACCGLGFSESGDSQHYAPALLYLPLLFLIWAALRFGPGGGSTALLTIVTLTILFAVNGRGPFTSQTPAKDIFGLQLFLIAISVPTLVLAAATDERRRATEGLRASETRNSVILRALPDMLFLNDSHGTYLDVNVRDQAELLVPPEQFLGKDIRYVLPPEIARRFLALFEQARRTGEVGVSEYELEFRGEKRWYEARVVGSDGDKFLTLVREITERRRAEQDLRESNEALGLLNEQLRATFEELEQRKDELQSANAELVAKVKEITQAHSDMQNLIDSTDIGTIFLDREFHLKLYTPLVRNLFDVRPRDLNRPFSELAHKLDYEAIHDDARRALADRGRIIREIRSTDGRWYIARILPYRTQEDRADGVVITFVDVTERKQAEQSLEQLSGRLLHLQDEERRRIARELHDSTAQNLSAIGIHLETLLQTASDLPAGFAKVVSESQSLCRQTQDEIRTLSYLLHPPLLDEAGLILALEWFIEGFSVRSGISVGFVRPSDFKRLPLRVETALFRIVQESLTNIYRHSDSKTAEIRLGRVGRQVRLVIRDRGRGMAANRNRPATAVDWPEGLGVGISGMKERARQLGGRLDINSDDGGTVVAVEMPIKEGDEA